ncbi:MAG: cysteine hydrolase [Gemmatimonadota bacterium]|nr:MAG: cysteine hydrolase [Gemmatimonadota bacterium]
MIDTRSTALLVVDVQEAAIARKPYMGEVVLDNIATLIDACRTAGVEVVYVQHDGQPGDDEEPGTKVWEIYDAIRPNPGEKVVRKRFNSAFRETDLRSYLEERGIGTLILVGIQTEYCVDTTCRVAFEYGFRVIVPEMANTTYDNGNITAGQIYDLVNNRILDGRFAIILSMRDALEAIAGRGNLA